MDYKSDTIMTCMEVVWKKSVWEKENNMPITGRAGQEQKENTDRAGVWNSQTFLRSDKRFLPSVPHGMRCPSLDCCTPSPTRT